MSYRLYIKQHIYTVYEFNISQIHVCSTYLGALSASSTFLAGLLGKQPIKQNDFSVDKLINHPSNRALTTKI